MVLYIRGVDRTILPLAYDVLHVTGLTLQQIFHSVRYPPLRSVYSLPAPTSAQLLCDVIGITNAMVVHIVFDIARSWISRNQVRRASTQWCNHPAHTRRKTHVIVPLLDEKLNVFSVPDVCQSILYFKKIRFGVLKIPTESDGRLAGWLVVCC